LQLAEANDRLAGLRKGSTLVKPEERQAVERAFADAMEQWAKRKRIFKNIWCVWVTLITMSIY
jgi:hypothetical protein